MFKITFTNESVLRNTPSHNISYRDDHNDVLQYLLNIILVELIY